MSAHPPPVPPDQRSDKGTGQADRASSQPKDEAAKQPLDEKIGRQGAVRQNTTNQGYQQDR